MKKTYLIESNGRVDFKLVKVEDKSVLYYEGSEWTEQTQGKVAATLVDTGDGLDVTGVLTIHEDKITLDYSQAQYLYLLLHLFHSGDNVKFFRPVKL
jgi:hypothetical protein